MRGIILALACVAALAAAPAVGATHACEPDNNALVSTGAVYLVYDEEALDFDYVSIRIYLESNGVPDLQRYDDWCSTPGYTAETADTVVF